MSFPAPPPQQPPHDNQGGFGPPAGGFGPGPGPYGPPAGGPPAGGPPPPGGFGPPAGGGYGPPGPAGPGGPGGSWPPPAPPGPPVPPSGGGNGGKIAAIIAAGAVVLAGTIAGVVIATGDDDPPAPPQAGGTNSSPSPSVSSTPSPSPSDSYNNPSGSDSYSSPSATPDGGKISYFQLKRGDCFNVSGSGNGYNESKSCYSPHDAEVVSIHQLSSGLTTDTEIKAKASELCKADLARVGRRQPAGTAEGTYVQFPNARGYRIGIKSVSCSMTGNKDNTRKLTKPLS